MNYTKDISGESATIKMKGQFTFSDHESFRDILAILRESNVTTLRLDFSGLEFVDSAALGMLLIAREEAQNANKSLVLSGATGQIGKMFKVSKFDDLFTID